LAFQAIRYRAFDARDILVERFMPDLVERLPAKRTESFDQAFGRMCAQGRAEGHG